jgi:hypothetical protein
VAPDFIVRGFPMPYRVHSDKAWFALLYVSSSNQPSSLPGVVDLKIGNGFTDLFLLSLLNADHRGVAEIQINVPGSIPISTTFHLQAITFDVNNFTLPLEVSNSQAAQVIA